MVYYASISQKDLRILVDSRKNFLNFDLALLESLVDSMIADLVIVDGSMRSLSDALDESESVVVPGAKIYLVAAR